MRPTQCALSVADTRSLSQSVNTGAVYSFYSGRDEDEVERAAVTIQRRLRGYRVRRQMLEDTGACFTRNLDIAQAARRASELKEAEMARAAAEARANDEQSSVLALALRRLQTSVERIEQEVRDTRAEMRRTFASGGGIASQPPGIDEINGPSAPSATARHRGRGLDAAGASAPTHQHFMADGAPSPAPQHLSLAGIPNRKRAGACSIM